MNMFILHKGNGRRWAAARQFSLVVMMVLLWVITGPLGAGAAPLNLLGDTITCCTGITAFNQWNVSGTTKLTWIITPSGPNWHYEYIWTTSAKDLSHIEIEVTEGTTISNYFNFNPNNNPEAGDPTTYGPGLHGNSDFGIPGNFFALKFTPSSDTTSYTFSFDSTQSPTWGDFYAIDGKKPGEEVYAYNAGFLAADQNDGLHIARPNGTPEPVVPEPSTFLLLGSGLAGLAAWRWRRNRPLFV